MQLPTSFGRRKRDRPRRVNDRQAWKAARVTVAALIAASRTSAFKNHGVQPANPRSVAAEKQLDLRGSAIIVIMRSHARTEQQLSCLFGKFVE